MRDHSPRPLSRREVLTRGALVAGAVTVAADGALANGRPFPDPGNIHVKNRGAPCPSYLADPTVTDQGVVSPGSLAEILGLIGSDEAEILFPCGSYDFATDLTLPINVNLVFTRGAVLHVNGVTLTVAASIHAGQYQIFNVTGGGEVIGTPNMRIDAVIPHWWGIDGDAFLRQDITASLDSAIHFLEGMSEAKQGTIHLPRGRYTVDAPVRIRRPISLIGVPNETILFPSPTFPSEGPLLHYEPATPTGTLQRVVVRDLILRTDPGKRTEGIRGVRLTKSSFESVFFYHLHVGARMYHSWSNTWSNCFFLGQAPYNGTGILLRAQCNHNSFWHCVFGKLAVGVRADGVELPGGTKPGLASVSFFGCNFENCQQAGLRVRPPDPGMVARGVAVSGCYMEKNTVDVELGASHGIVVGVDISGNYFNASFGGGYQNSIIIQNSTGVNVTANNCTRGYVAFIRNWGGNCGVAVKNNLAESPIQTGSGVTASDNHSVPC